MQSDKSEPSEAEGAECVSASDAEKKALRAAGTGGPEPRGISAVAVLWTFGKCLGALLPVYLAGYYRVSTSLLVFGMMVYTGWKHAREAKETRLRSAMQLLDNEEEYMSTKAFRGKRGLPAWVRNEPDGVNTNQLCPYPPGTHGDLHETARPQTGAAVTLKS